MTEAGIYYIDSGTRDREERIEEDVLREALVSRIPGLIPLPHRPDQLPPAGSVVYGRITVTTSLNQGFAWPKARDIVTPYWNDETFVKYAGRKFDLVDWDGACSKVDELHAQGGRAFIKAIDDKMLAEPVPAGMRLLDHLEDLAFSFIDRQPCLMVQDLVPMRHEYRIMVINGTPITGAGRIEHTTPLDNEAPFDPKMVATPDGAVEHDQARADRYQAFARMFANETKLQNYSLDLCEIEGDAAVVELNPMQPGRLGLFAIDIDLFADAVVSLTTPRLQLQPGPPTNSPKP